MHIQRVRRRRGRASVRWVVLWPPQLPTWADGVRAVLLSLSLRAGCTRSSACLTRTMASRFRFGRVRGKAPRRGSNASAGAALHGVRGVSCVKTTRIVAVHRVMNVRQLLGMPEVCEQQQGVATGGVSAGAFRVVLYTDALRLLFTRELGAAGFQLWTVTFPVCNGFNDVSSSSSSSSRPVGLGRGTRPSRARRVRAGRATSEVRGPCVTHPDEKPYRRDGDALTGEEVRSCETTAERRELLLRARWRLPSRPLSLPTTYSLSPARR